jgi:hypothetical protein
MDHYDYAGIISFTDRVEISCTSSADMEGIIPQLKQIFPNFKLETAIFLSGEIFHWDTIWPSQKDASGAKWWIIKQLCSRGWEPLSPTGFVIRETPHFYHCFRRRTQA